MNIDSNTTIYLNNTEIVQIYDGGGQVIWQKGSTPPTPINYFYIKNEYSGSNTFTFFASKGYNMYDGVYYSTDKTNWTYLNKNDTVSISSNSKIYLKSNDFSPSGDYSASMSCNNKFSIGGDITTLFYTNYGLYADNVFRGSVQLTSVANVDMSNVNCYCSFSGTFLNCNLLTDCLDLSGVTSGIFTEMYYNCTSLKKAIAPTVSSWNTSYFTDWLKNVGSGGVFYNYYSGIPLNSASGVPSGWTTQ